jgi:N-acyl-D-aspartate/D-glutamate deacylase
VYDLPGGNPRLFQRAEGMLYTIVNGTPVTKNGEHLGTYPGKLLRGAGPTM